MMRNSRRGLAAGVNFIWDLPMTLLLRFSNIHRHRGRPFHLLNSIQLGYALMLWILRGAAGSAAGERYIDAADD